MLYLEKSKWSAPGRAVCWSLLACRGKKKITMKVSLFITCFNDTLFPQAGRATVQLLERLGHTVDFPEEQTCCGQMHFNTGYQREALPLIQRFVRIFEQAEVVVAPSASCVG